MEVTGEAASPLKKGMVAGAQSELYRRITGSDVVYDPEDPSVEQKVVETATQAVKQGFYFDTQGKRHELTWDGPTQVKLATEHMKRVMGQS